ncbi:uncharacterized protein PRCAT00001494001 [Priceomyces carsonii]|uniref:uncharacterized protein n=1 Tax=Priceomyces carsonii TaxID=28549 RepID=UPI002EDB0D91|nr:unnamed protein product [Priceomyces carsonii]
MSFLFINTNEILKKFPDTADTLLVDCYLSDQPNCSSRVFRLYSRIPKHFHRTCDETLFLLSGKAEFYIGDEKPRYIEPGEMVTFFKNTVHGVKALSDEPVVFLSFDTPRRNPDDVCFVNPEETKGVKFISHIEK